jgi:transcription elongation factor GreB
MERVDPSVPFWGVLAESAGIFGAIAAGDQPVVCPVSGRTKLLHLGTVFALSASDPALWLRQIGAAQRVPSPVWGHLDLLFALPRSGVMNKAFTRETDGDGDDDDDEVALPALPQGTKNYLTPAGWSRLRGELLGLLDTERPKIVEIVSWAAKNGDRSENGDYLYGKKRLREIDRRIRFLTQRLDIAEVVDPSLHHGHDQVFFGATVTYANQRDERRTITIKGIDEADSARGEVSWVSPVARALMKARVGDEVQLLTPGGLENIEVLAVAYPPASSKKG